MAAQKDLSSSGRVDSVIRKSALILHESRTAGVQIGAEYA